MLATTIRTNTSDPWSESTWGDTDRDVLPLALHKLSTEDYTTFIQLTQRCVGLSCREQEKLFDVMGTMLPELLVNMRTIYEDEHHGGHRPTPQRSKVLDAWIADHNNYRCYMEHAYNRTPWTASIKRAHVVYPSVSVVMPCGYGDRYFRVALNCFLNQTYEGQLDIIILDNNDVGKTIEHLLPADTRIKYRRCKRMTNGELRNLGNSYAAGEIICNFDEDDWYAPDRVAVQVKRLQDTGKAVTGFHNILFYDMDSGRHWRYTFLPEPTTRTPLYACGTSQMYLRTWWEKHRYPNISKGEDYQFQKEALDAKQLDSIDAGLLAVARAHADSTSPARSCFGTPQFRGASSTQFPSGFHSA